jgi:tRNA CCA-adding enzyme
MTKKIDNILKEVLGRIRPPKQELIIFENDLKNFLKKLEKKIKSLKIIAEIFIGGSFAKNTLIKKDCYDIDVFIRFNNKYENSKISDMTKKILKQVDNFSIIHGSRDYFKIKKRDNFFIELIPVIKVKNSKESKNITDLSYSHVKYIKKKIKSKKILEEIMIAKAFCYANRCYGAESYINGFSGYSLELLIYYYGGFLKFIKAIAKHKKDKIIIDIEKQYKNKQIILMDLNGSKLHSPIILIDPTYKQRNVSAALSEKTFIEFKKNCEKFLKNPSIESFEIKKIDLEKIKQNAKNNKLEFILIETQTNKQEGDVAGTKLLKFYKHLDYEISKLFEIKNKGFNYNDKKSARYFFVVKKKENILLEGPFLKDKKNINLFKKKHKKTFTKKGKIYAKEKIKLNLKEFTQRWKIKNKKRLKEMSISDFKII